MIKVIEKSRERKINFHYLRLNLSFYKNNIKYLIKINIKIKNNMRFIYFYTL